MRDSVDVAIIGAGVVGAAVAQRLARRGMSCFLLERRAKVGGETTERNSGVIHAGLYYPAESLKTKLCIRGRHALYVWAEQRNVAHSRCGKLIVAQTEAEESSLQRLLEHGKAVGVDGLRLISSTELSALEPDVIGRAALLSSETGIVDPVELTNSLVTDAQDAGTEVIVSARVNAIRPHNGGYRLNTERGPLDVAAIVNAAGLYADEVAAMIPSAAYRLHPCRGDYFRLRTRARFHRLIYPVKTPGSPGLGIHLTIDLAGGVRLGPDTEWVDAKDDYAANDDESKRLRFLHAAQKLVRDVQDDDLTYDSCGIRPKLRSPSESVERDFVIAEDAPRFVNLVGIESPGLTSALAIAEEVERFLC